MLKGLSGGGGLVNLSMPTSFRTSHFMPEGLMAAKVVEAVVVDIDLVRWTVDCLSKFDQHRFLNIQVGSPYVHSNRGEGIYALPDVGAKCLVCIPSDGTAPVVLAFIMPPVSLAAETEEQENQTEQGAPIEEVPAYSFNGGRPRPKPGDIAMRGRDGNFAILHRGGVLQIGATSLAQRIYIPVGNILTDISQNYRHYNAGGSINWGVKVGPSEDHPPTSLKQTFRLFADEEEASVRIAMGTFADVVGEPSGDSGATSDLNQLEINDTDDKPIVLEVTLAPEGFNADRGDLGDGTVDKTKLRFFFDKAGGTFLRSESAVHLRVKKKLRIVTDDNFEVFCKKDIIMQADGVVSIIGKDGLEIGTSGAAIKINGGSKPVAHVGSIINIITTVPIPITTPAGPGTIIAGAVFNGQIATGNPTILV